MEHYRYYPGNMSGDASGDMLYAKYGYLDYSYNNGSPYYFNESVSKDTESTNTEDKQGNRATFVILGGLIIICAMILILEFLKDFYL